MRVREDKSHPNGYTTAKSEPATNAVQAGIVVMILPSPQTMQVCVRV